MSSDIVQASEYAKNKVKERNRQSRLGAGQATDYAKNLVAEKYGTPKYEKPLNIFEGQEYNAQELDTIVSKIKPDMSDPDAQSAYLDAAANVTGTVGHSAIGAINGLTTLGLADVVVSKFGEAYAEKKAIDELKQKNMYLLSKGQSEDGNPFWDMFDTDNKVRVRIDPRKLPMDYDKNLGQLYGRLTGMGKQTPLQQLGYDIAEWTGLYRGAAKVAGKVAANIPAGIRTTRIAGKMLAATGTQAAKEVIDNLSADDPISRRSIGLALVLGSVDGVVGESLDILRGRYVMRQIAAKYPEILSGLSPKDKRLMYEAAEAWEVSSRTDPSGWSAFNPESQPAGALTGTVSKADPLAIKTGDMARAMKTGKAGVGDQVYKFKTWESVYGKDIERIGQQIKDTATKMGYDPVDDIILAKDKLAPIFEQQARLKGQVESKTVERGSLLPERPVRVSGGDITEHPGKLYGSPTQDFATLTKVGGGDIVRPKSLSEPLGLLKNPISKLSQKELESRISHDSPYHDDYVLERDIRRLEKGEVLEGSISDYTKNYVNKLQKPVDATKWLEAKIDRVIVTPERRDVISSIREMSIDDIDPTAYERPEAEYKTMGVDKYLTPKYMVARREGWEPLVKEVEQGKLQANVDVQRMNRLASLAMQEFNKRSTIGEKTWAAIKNKPTAALESLHSILDNYENAPDWYPEDAKLAHSQLRQYMKMSLEAANKGRVARGVEPIKDIGAYVPHYIDRLAWEVLNKKYPIKSGYIYSLMKGLPNDISNPSAKHRELVDAMSEHFSKDLPDLLTTMFRHHYEDAYVTTPYIDAYQAIQNANMSESVRNDAISYLKYDIRHMSVDLDKAVDKTLDTLKVTDVMNLFLSPFGRKVVSASGSLSRLFRTMAYAGGMGLKPYLGVRNSLQTLLAFDLYSAPDIMAAYKDKALGFEDITVDPKTGRETKVMDLVREQPWYKQSVDSATENDLQSRAVSFATKSSGMEFTHKQVLDMAVRIGFKDWERYYNLSQDKDSKHYQRAREIAVKELMEEAKAKASEAKIGKDNKARELTGSERKQFGELYVKKNIDSKLSELLVTKDDMLPMIRDSIRMIEWEYFSTSMPWLHRGSVAKSALVYTSWMQNYFFAHQREMWVRVLSGRDTKGKLLTPAQRIRPIKGLGTLYAIARASEAVLGSQYVAESIMPSPNSEVRVPPAMELLIGAGYYYFSDDEEQQAKGKRMLEHSKKLLVPFAGGAKFLGELASGKRQPSEAIFGPKKKEQ